MMWRSDDDRVARTLETEWLSVDDIEHPGVLAVYRYWDRVRAGRVGPPVREFRLDEQAPEIIPYMAVVDFRGPPLDFHYRFFGSKMVENAGQDLTGKTYYADGVTGYGFVNAEVFPKMIEARRPVFTRTRWISVRGVEKITISTRLPLSEDGRDITGGVTVNHYRSVDENGEAG